MFVQLFIFYAMYKILQFSHLVATEVSIKPLPPPLDTELWLVHSSSRDIDCEDRNYHISRSIISKCYIDNPVKWVYVMPSYRIQATITEWRIMLISLRFTITSFVIIYKTDNNTYLSKVANTKSWLINVGYPRIYIGSLLIYYLYNMKSLNPLHS